MAPAIVHHARPIGARYAWVGVDGGYGREPLFLKALDEEGEHQDGGGMISLQSTGRGLATCIHS